MLNKSEGIKKYEDDALFVKSHGGPHDTSKVNVEASGPLASDCTALQILLTSSNLEVQHRVGVGLPKLNQHAALHLLASRFGNWHTSIGKEVLYIVMQLRRMSVSAC